MKDIIEKLKAKVQTDPAHFCSYTSMPILNVRYWHYCEDVGTETAERKVARDDFNGALEFFGSEKE